MTTLSFRKLLGELLKPTAYDNVLSRLSTNDLDTLFEELCSAWNSTLACKLPSRRKLPMSVRLGMEIRDLRNHLCKPSKIQRPKTTLGRLDEPEYTQLANMMGSRLSSIIPEFNLRTWGEATGTVALQE